VKSIDASRVYYRTTLVKPSGLLITNHVIVRFSGILLMVLRDLFIESRNLIKEKANSIGEVSK
jgi:hypothetical protein